MNFNPKLIEFFKRHNLYDETIFKYISENSTMIDYDYEENRAFIGCLYIVDKNNKLKKIHVIIPYVQDEKTMLISIHELIHAIFAYQKINKKFIPDITIESLPMLYERLYIIEKADDELSTYGAYLDSTIAKDDKNSYYFGLQIRDKLLNKYDKNISKMEKLTKRLSKKYLKHN